MSAISTGYNERLFQFAEVRTTLSIHGSISSLNSLTTTIMFFGVSHTNCTTFYYRRKKTKNFPLNFTQKYRICFLTLPQSNINVILLKAMPDLSQDCSVSFFPLPILATAVGQILQDNMAFQNSELGNGKQVATDCPQQITTSTIPQTIHANGSNNYDSFCSWQPSIRDYCNRTHCYSEDIHDLQDFHQH